MGLKFTKPNSQIRLFLDRNKRDYYTNLDPVKGEVTLVLKHKANLKSVKVILSGQSCTSMTYLVDLSANKTLLESHNLVYRGKELLSQDVALKPGTYKFPFELIIPGERFNIACLERGLHEKIYNDACAEYQTFDLPPSFEYRGLGNAKVEYFIKAVIEMNSKESGLKLVEIEPIKFFPRRKFTSFNKSHLKCFVESANETTAYFKYDAEEPIASPIDKRNSFLTRLRSNSNTSSAPVSPYIHSRRHRSSTSGMKVDLPITLNINYSHTISMNFDTKGVLELGSALNSSFRLTFTTPMSPQQLQERISSGKSFDSSQNEKFTVSNLQLKLLSNLSLKAEHMLQEQSNKADLVSKSIDPFSVTLSDFKQVSGYCQTHYVYEIDPSLYGDILWAQLPSFEVCNIRNDYQLQVSLDLSAQGVSQKKSLKLNSDTIVVND